MEIFLFRGIPPFWVRQLHDFCDDVKIPHPCLRATLDSWEEPLPTLDTPLPTAYESMDSTLRDEPPKTMTFYENLGRLCSEDDPGWNRSITRETTGSTTTAYLGYPGVRKVKNEVWESTSVEQ